MQNWKPIMKLVFRVKLVLSIKGKLNKKESSGGQGFSSESWHCAWHLLCNKCLLGNWMKEDFLVWGLKEEGHFDSLTGTFFFLRLPPSKLFQMWNNRDWISWGLPFPENSTGNSLGFILPCPMAIPLTHSSSQWKKGRQIASLK